MGEAFAVNASPLIFFTQAGRLDLLRLAGETGVVPTAVIRELEAGSNIHDTAQVVRAADWLEIVEAPDPVEAIRIWDLGDGESSVLSWVFQARRCAATLGLSVRGTLGLILAAKQRGVIAEARPLVEQMREAGMYLSDAVVNGALRKIGE